MKSKAIMTAGIILWATLLMASRVSAAEEPVVITEEVDFWADYYGQRYDIDPAVIKAMAWHESRCIPSAQSEDKKCKGILQINPNCHRERMDRLKARNVFDTGQNIHVGIDYLWELLAEEGGKLEPALTRYNGQNEAAVEDARNGKPGRYVKKILETAEELRKEKK
jgi:soluble lytic murein transglycosylase-like protein